MPMPFAEPVSVVALLELQQRQTQLLDRVERVDPEQLLFERANESLGHAVALGSPARTRGST